MTGASDIATYVNRIGTAVPTHDIHAPFTAFGRTMLRDEKSRTVFDRMAERAAIAHRWSYFVPGDLDAGEVDAGHFYRPGAFPTTAARMALYEPWSLELSLAAVAALDIEGERDRVTHLVVASCTGFSAPGLDLLLCERLGLAATVERTLIGFMGCSSAVPALRAAHHIVRADPAARVLVVNCELSSLHLQETSELENVLTFMLFADGAAAALVSADPAGFELRDFRNKVLPDSADLITWHIGDQGFDMHLSGKVPGRIGQALREELGDGEAGLLRGEGAQAVDLWAVHAGGRTVLDAVEIGLSLGPTGLRHSRAVLREYGNMSSATVMFALAAMLRDPAAAQGRGMAMAFGPGVVAETFRFRMLG